jgi:hypothetical protein
MESKEIVQRAIDFSGPARLPICYSNRDFEYSDVRAASFAPAAGFSPSQRGETEWGYVWVQLDKTMGQPHSPPITDADSLLSYTPPDPGAPGRLDHLRDQLAGCADKFLVFDLGITGFDQATFLRGFEDLLTDLYSDPKTAQRVLEIVFGFESALIERLADYPIDCVKFADDWGTQKGLIISPELWRKVFRPRYAAQFERVHRLGKKVWFHSCGDVSHIIGDFIDIGVNVLELLQPDLLGVERLAREFGGKMCFCCSVDHQRCAISGTREEIFHYAKTLNDTLGAFDGGLIAMIEDYSCLGMSEQNYQWIREAFHTIAGTST